MTGLAADLADLFDDQEQAFLDWLSSKPREKQVGRPGDSRGCPLVCWADESRGVGILMYGETFRHLGSPMLYDTPAWVHAVVNVVDELKDARYRRIQAGELLDALAANKATPSVPPADDGKS